jgi:hypothetical protein
MGGSGHPGMMLPASSVMQAALSFSSVLLRYILDPEGSQNDGLTPMERFKLALNMNPGLDGLYQRILQGGKAVDCFSDIVYTLALLQDKVSIYDLSLILGIPPFKVVNALIPVQSIIQVPGDDRTRDVTMFHTSQRFHYRRATVAGHFFIG